MTLIQDLQDSILDDDKSISTILRGALVLASRLKNSDLRMWVDSELNGYNPGELLPDYRTIPCHVLADAYGLFGSGVKNLSISESMVSGHAKEMVNQMVIRNAVNVIEDMVDIDEPVLHFILPVEFVQLLNNERSDMEFSFADARRVTGKSNVKGILDRIRTRLLNFILELEDIGDVSDLKKFVSEHSSDVTSAFKTIIIGDNNVIASDLSESPINSNQGVSVGDIASLLNCFRDLGVPSSDLDELEESIVVDGDVKLADGFGSRVTSWVGEMVTKAGNGFLKHGVSEASSAIIAGLNSFYK